MNFLGLDFMHSEGKGHASVRRARGLPIGDCHNESVVAVNGDGNPPLRGVSANS